MADLSRKDVCVIIPAFNAAETIATVLKEVVRRGYPVIVINDGSSDRTADRVKSVS